MVRITDSLDMTIAVDWDIKQQTNQIIHNKFSAKIQKQNV